MQRVSSPKSFLWIFHTLTILSCLSTKVAGLRNANNHRNISDLLDNLLRGYDNSIRPDFGVGYTTRDLIYVWNKPVDISDDMKMSQFDLISTPQGNSTDTLRSGQRSSLIVSFHFQRHMGNFLIQVYGPSSLLVCISWVSFWLNREATADRISLGVTTVLTMTFLGLEARTDLPKVAYPTALDFFVFLSFAFIFATIIQFAVVHFFTKKGSGEMYFYDSTSDESEDDEENMPEFKTENNPISPNVPVAPYVNPSSCFPEDQRQQPMAMIEFPSVMKSTGEQDSPSAIPGCPKQHAHPRHPAHPYRKESIFRNLCTQGSQKKKKRKLTLEERVRQEVNSVSKIDKFARIFFPASYIVINIFYWYWYLATDETY